MRKKRAEVKKRLLYFGIVFVAILLLLVFVSDFILGKTAVFLTLKEAVKELIFNTWKSFVGERVLFAPSCSSGYADNVSQWNITWFFDRCYRVGQFVNGDWWVVGPVNIVRITPDNYTNSSGTTPASLHGWMVNPGKEVHPLKDWTTAAFDSRTGYVFGGISTYNASLMPSLPYLASGNLSLVKVRSAPYNNGVCFSCILDASILTVLDSMPPTDAFRPPFSSTEKPLYLVRNLQTQFLPSLALPNPLPSDYITKEQALLEFQMTRLDFFTISVGSTWYIPYNSIGIWPGDTWGGDIARHDSKVYNWLMLNHSMEDKLPVLIGVVQYGIDLHGTFSGALEYGRNHSWTLGGGGNGVGRFLPFVFAGTMLNSLELKADFPLARTNNTFWEDISYYRSSVTGGAYWGQIASGDIHNVYWNDLVAFPIGKTARDPYESIDGGTSPGSGSYQGNVFHPTKYIAFVFQMIPKLKEDLGVDISLLDYVDRFMIEGAGLQPDSCAPVMGRCFNGTRSGEICTFAAEGTNGSLSCPGSYCAAGICESNSYYSGQPCSYTEIFSYRVLGPGNGTYKCGPRKTIPSQSAICVFNITNEFYKKTYGPAPGASSQFPSTCIQDTDSRDGIGRFPQLFGRNKGGLGIAGARTSDFGEMMWVSYRNYTFIPLGNCTNGQTRNCALQQGVCAGSQETCTGGNWPGCAIASYGADYQIIEANCNDGKDNDCNGLIDNNDNNCAVIDIIPPVISSIVNNSITNQSVIVSWQTDEGAISRIYYGLATNLGLDVFELDYLVAHALQLVDLLSNTTYYYKVGSCDIWGNCANSSLFNFRTLSVFVDNEGPIINLVAPADGNDLNINSVTFSYTPNDFSSISSCTLYLGVETRVDSAIENSIENNFSVNLANGYYYWSISCVDSSGNIGNSETRTLNINYQAPVDTSGGGGYSSGGGGGGSYIMPQPKVDSIKNETLISNKGIDKISLQDGEVGFVDIGLLDSVVLDLYSILYEIRFEVSEVGVLLKVPNGDYLIPKDDILPVLLGGQEMYVAVKRADANGAGIILGLNRELVQEQLGASSVEEETSTAYIVIGIIIFVIGIVLLVGYIIYRRDKAKQIEPAKWVGK